MRPRLVRILYLVLLLFLVAANLSVFNNRYLWNELATVLIVLVLLGVTIYELAQEPNRVLGSSQKLEKPDPRVGDVPFPFLVLDEANRLVDFSLECLEILPELKEGRGKHLLDIFPVIDEEQLSQVRGYLNYHPFSSLELTIARDMKTVEHYQILFQNWKQNPGWLVGLAIDRTLEHRERQELIQAKEMLDQFLENIPGSVYIKDARGTLVYQNQQSIFECMEFPDLHVFLTTPAPLPRRRSGIPASVRAQSRKFSEEVREWEVWQFPIATSLEQLEAGVLFDVTNRRQQESRLTESQAFLEATLNHSPVGLIILDGKTTSIRVANEELKRLFGIDPSENLTGRSINFEKLEWKIFQQDGQPFPIEHHPVYQAFFQGQAWSGRVVLRNATNATRYAMVNSAPVYDYRRQFLAVVVVVTDITELVDAERRLQELNRELENRVEERTQDLRTANLELQEKIEELRETQQQLIETEKMASLGNLVAGVAHEINTPIGVGVTAASLLDELTTNLHKKLTAGSLTRSEFDEYLDKARLSCQVILTNLERASKLIQSFKLISVDQNTDPLRIFKVKEYLEDVFRSLHPPERRIHLDIRVQGDEELCLHSYPGAFSQIITNLYMNSCLHGFEGRDQGTILTQFLCDGPWFFLHYEDDGKGMDTEIQKKIFEPFFSTRRNRGGTGLGMHIVYNLVTQKLGGSITVQSTPGRGTKFILKIPYSASPASTEGKVR